MAAFRDDMPLLAGVNENWDEDTTRSQIVNKTRLGLLAYTHANDASPSSKFLRLVAPREARLPCVLPCGLPTGNFMPAESAQIRLMTASPVTLQACIPAPDQVTPEEAYFKDLDFHKKTFIRLFSRADAQ